VVALTDEQLRDGVCKAIENSNRPLLLWRAALASFHLAACLFQSSNCLEHDAYWFNRAPLYSAERGVDWDSASSLKLDGLTLQLKALAMNDKQDSKMMLRDYDLNSSGGFIVAVRDSERYPGGGVSLYFLPFRVVQAGVVHGVTYTVRGKPLMGAKRLPGVPRWEYAQTSREAFEAEFAALRCSLGRKKGDMQRLIAMLSAAPPPQRLRWGLWARG